MGDVHRRKELRADRILAREHKENQLNVSLATAPTREHEVVDESALVDVQYVKKVQYARIAADGRELRLGGRALPGVYEREPYRGEVLVTTFQRPDGPNGKQPRVHGLVTATIVPAGTIAAAIAHATKKKEPPAPAPVDGLAEFRAQIPRTIVPLRSEAEDPNKSILSKSPAVILTKGRPGLRGVAEIVALLRRHGTTILGSTATGELITESTALQERDRLLLANPDARRLLSAWIDGKPLLCAWPHGGKKPEAVTTAAGGAPVCAEHIGDAKP